ncbi:MAG TPA: GTPase HflX [Nitrospinota bacterium]|nr:GTPase HflX [Nitrospinota bacterium]
MGRYITEISRDINRQIGILVNRQGTIEYVVLGDTKEIVIPPLKRMRLGLSRFRGLRCIHTHLKEEPLNQDDLSDLALLRLDMMTAIGVLPNGLPGLVYSAHLIPENSQRENWEQLIPIPFFRLDLDFPKLIHSLEDEFTRVYGSRKIGDERDRAILVNVTTDMKIHAEESLNELKELAKSNNLVVLDKIIQYRKVIDPKYVLGKGKLNDLIIRALQLGADLIIFDRELTPAQIRSISDVTELKIIDRTQLILDIFAQRAKSNDGKVQVGLAQLRYLLPRLITKNTAMSRLTGGIGGRGPGETKLEINRRRVRDKINRLQKELKSLSKHRSRQRIKRKKSGLPIISIIGYTNAGKSTLLNSLTKSSVETESRLFATLDPTTRRLRFPRDMEVVITDTVGFIKNLPKDLMEAFHATLDELKEADLLLHIIDISNPNFEEHIKAVRKILFDLSLDEKPVLLVLNKEDRLEKEFVKNLCNLYDAVSICAKNPSTLKGLIEKIQFLLLGSPPDSVSDSWQNAIKEFRKVNSSV